MSSVSNFGGSDCALVVDDDPILVEVAASILRKRGVRDIVRALNGSQALNAYARRPDIKLVICDLQMPEMDGIAFLSALARQGYAGAVVIVSSLSDSLRALARDLGKSHGLNVIGELRKPLSAAKLFALLDGVENAPAKSTRQGEGEVSLSALRDAIASGAIVSYYQPKVDIATGKLVGAEALARWVEPDGSIMAPDRFIPVAERNGLIGAIDTAVMRCASNDLPRLQSVMPSLALSVNAGAETLNDLAVYDMLVELVSRNGLRSSDFTLEITESKALRRTNSVMEVLGRLRVAGFELSIDDFGTGHSNLETLREFPFTEIKIDRTFVAEALSSNSANASVEACLLLARELGLNVVAEGVETAKHWQFLEAKGSIVAQGFYIAKPMPMDKFAVWMRSGAALQ